MSSIKIGYYLLRIGINQLSIREKRLSIVLIACLVLLVSGCAKVENTVNAEITTGDININVPDSIDVLIEGELDLSVTQISTFDGFLVVRYMVESEGVIKEVCELIDMDDLIDFINIREAESTGECPAT